MDKKEIGDRGELEACKYLLDNDYVIERRNFRLNFAEIDIIAIDKDGCRVFIEVKTRKSTSYGYASEFVDYKKQRKIKNAALAYCGGECYMRFDIIEVYYKSDGDKMVITEINHIEDAF